MLSAIRHLFLILLAVSLGAPPSALAQGTSLLNVSYDVARDFYKDYNPMFEKHWKTLTGETIEAKQSHAGSSKQVRAVADGLEADVVTMNQASDVDLLTKDLWRGTTRVIENASPYTLTMVFIVRKGNPGR